MTSPDHWRRVEEVFRDALEVPEGERGAWLSQCCSGDDRLQREVERLLDAGSGEESPRIAGIIEDAAASLFDEDAPPDAMAGQELGHYRIIRELGRGGMGAVYLAVRADETFDKQVAIKLVKRGIDTDAVLERFWYERRILAGLEHPYIARLIDGGTSPDGRPYFVMEYVDGKPLDSYAREHELPVGRCCELISKVCEAVSYAHRNLVIHRDLKPGNVLVTADGTPKLVDFGIARLLSMDPAQQTLAGGGMGRALTPEFASPEQLRGEAVTTATDVYSLGATLKAITPAGREAPQDLATIVDKAMREEIDQRYGSVGDLREDLRRFLNGLPILAREQALHYQARMFVRRHRVGVGVFAAATLLGAAAVGAILWESHRAGVEKRQAEQRLSQAVDMAERTLAEVNHSMASLPGTTQVRRDIVRGTLDYLDRLAKDSGGDPRVLTAMATAYLRVGEVLGNRDSSNLGDLPGALATYRKAVEILKGLLEKSPEDLRIRELAAEAHQGAGLILEIMGREKEAIEEDRTAVNFADSTLDRDPGREAFRERSLRAHYQLDEVFSNMYGQGSDKDALKELPLARALAEADPGNLSKQDLLSEYYAVIGTSLLEQDRSQESLPYFRKAVEIREAIHRSSPRDARYQENLLLAYGHVGDVLGSPYVNGFKDYRGAIEYYRKAARIAEDMYQADPSDTRAAVDVGMVWTRIGGTQRLAKDLQASNRSFDRALAVFEPMLKSTPGNAASRGGVMLAFNTRGQNLVELGDLAGGAASFRTCLAIADKMIAEGRTDATTRIMRVGAMGQLAYVEALEGDRAAALTLAEKAIAASEDTAAHGGSQLSLARSWFYDAQTHEALGDCAGAKAGYGKAVEKWKTIPTLMGSFADQMHEAERKVAHCGAK